MSFVERFVQRQAVRGQLSPDQLAEAARQGLDLSPGTLKATEQHLASQAEHRAVAQKVALVVGGLAVGAGLGLFGGAAGAAEASVIDATAGSFVGDLPLAEGLSYVSAGEYSAGLAGFSGYAATAGEVLKTGGALIGSGLKLYQGAQQLQQLTNPKTGETIAVAPGANPPVGFFPSPTPGATRTTATRMPTVPASASIIGREPPPVGAGPIGAIIAVVIVVGASYFFNR